eukprot:70925_1
MADFKQKQAEFTKSISSNDHEEIATSSVSPKKTPAKTNPVGVSVPATPKKEGTELDLNFPEIWTPDPENSDHVVAIFELLRACCRRSARGSSHFIVVKQLTEFLRREFPKVKKVFSENQMIGASLDALGDECKQKVYWTLFQDGRKYIDGHLDKSIGERPFVFWVQVDPSACTLITEKGHLFENCCEIVRKIGSVAEIPAFVVSFGSFLTRAMQLSIRTTEIFTGESTPKRKNSADGGQFTTPRAAKCPRVEASPGVGELPKSLTKRVVPLKVKLAIAVLREAGYKMPVKE